jgi:hypothetical protein
LINERDQLREEIQSNERELKGKIRDMNDKEQEIISEEKDFDIKVSYFNQE